MVWCVRIAASGLWPVYQIDHFQMKPCVRPIPWIFKNQNHQRIPPALFMALRAKFVRRWIPLAVLAMIALKRPVFVHVSRLGCAADLRPEDVGGKASVLHKILKTYPELPAILPDGLVVRTSLLRDVLAADLQHLQEVVDSGIDTDINAELGRIQRSLTDVSFPNELILALESFAADHPGSRFAVRSSAIMEDSMASACAGLFSSELKVRVQELVDAIKAVWKSAFKREVL